jgi:hypothetical protein
MSDTVLDGGAGELAARVLEELRRQGVSLESLGAGECCDGETPIKVVAVTANVGQALEALGGTKRDQVVMVRVDLDTAERLDAWVRTGAVRSRSEAAALFIREGLQVRAEELRSLREALEDVENARDRLRERVKEMLGLGEDENANR